MRNSRPALILYFVSGILFLISVILNNNELMLLSKPIIIPSILFFYFQEKKQNKNWWYFLIMLLCFAGDMALLINPNDSFLFVLLVFLIAYLIFLKEILRDALKINFHFKQKSHLLVLLICFFFLMYLLITLLDIAREMQQKYMVVLLFYGITLLLLGIVSSYNYILNPLRANFFMVLSAVCFIISDVFYEMRLYFDNFLIFDCFNNIVQVLSYYYVTKYFLSRRIN